MWLFPETQKEMWLLVSEWLATPVIGHRSAVCEYNEALTRDCEFSTARALRCCAIEKGI